MTEAIAQISLIEEIFEALDEPVVLVDGARKVVAANSAARAFFSAGMVGRNVALSIRHPDVLETMEAALGGNRGQAVEVTLGAAPPTNYRVRATPLAASDGSRTLIVFHDVTAARQTERMRADFVANVSHELRSPLTSLLGFIETLRGAARGDEAARERFLEIMEGEAKRMARLIDELLSLSRVEAGEHLPPQGAVDIAKLLREITGSLEMRVQERGMKFVLECPGDLSPIAGDHDELTMVFRNLLDNAISYGRQGTEITITARPVERIQGTSGPGIAVAVRDRGEGISADHIPRLTERFYRVDKGRSRSMGGTGLGLAIVKHIVSHHRGRLSVQSTPGEGSVFTVYLPR